MIAKDANLLFSLNLTFICEHICHSQLSILGIRLRISKNEFSNLIGPSRPKLLKTIQNTRVTPTPFENSSCSSVIIFLRNLAL